MPIDIQWSRPNALSNRVEAVQRAALPSSPIVRAYRADMAGIVAADHERKMLSGIDKFGKPRAPLAPSTLKKKRRGPGPSLIPLNLASRFYTNFRLEWVQEGGIWVLKIGWEPILSKRGISITKFHRDGCRVGSNPRRPNWSLPARNVEGITPQGMAEVRKRHQELPLEILSKAGRFGTYRS